jgi:hypothetical protein
MPRNTAERIADAIGKLEHDQDVWVATGDGRGHPHLVPFSLYWDGRQVIVTTLKDSTTTPNLRTEREAHGRVLETGRIGTRTALELRQGLLHRRHRDGENLAGHAGAHLLPGCEAGGHLVVIGDQIDVRQSVRGTLPR